MPPHHHHACCEKQTPENRGGNRIREVVYGITGRSQRLSPGRGWPGHENVDACLTPASVLTSSLLRGRRADIASLNRSRCVLFKHTQNRHAHAQPRKAKLGAPIRARLWANTKQLSNRPGTLNRSSRVSTSHTGPGIRWRGLYRTTSRSWTHHDPDEHALWAPARSAGIDGLGPGSTIYAPWHARKQTSDLSLCSLHALARVLRRQKFVFLRATLGKTCSSTTECGRDGGELGAAAPTGMSSSCGCIK